MPPYEGHRLEIAFVLKCAVVRSATLNADTRCQYSEKLSVFENLEGQKILANFNLKNKEQDLLQPKKQPE